MVTLLVYAVALFLAVLISERAERSVISTAVLFLVAGFLSGGNVLGLVQLRADHPVVENLSMLALFSVLLTDGMRMDVHELRKAWHLPGRALLAGMPLGFGITLLLAHFVGGLSWRESLLISGVLAPTDPVFAAAIVGRKEIPQRVRRLLNVESGVNDGLALPVIVWMLASFRHAPSETASLFGSVAFGVALGIFVAWLALRIERSEWFAASSVYEPFDVVAIGLVIFAAASLTGANPYLAAFAAGITITSARRPAPEPSRLFGERVTELLKLAALLVFGALISPRLLAEVPPRGYAFAALVLFLARPVALGIALVGSGLSRREKVVAAWFGPKGFASVLYAILVLRTGFDRSHELFHLVAVVVAGSIVLHSSTDVLMARWLSGQHRPGTSSDT